MEKQSQAGVYKDIACAVIAGKKAGRLGQGDVVADQRIARQVRAAARAIFDEIVEEMNVLEE